eukprot:GFYU01010926.1.p1 GENE.GFYU01010926.1~~GFYU01010926.1.p1  ORF type:complete len:348 (-),score=88.59 GFYU01010926.1:33-1076(-)
MAASLSVSRKLSIAAVVVVVATVGCLAVLYGTSESNDIAGKSTSAALAPTHLEATANNATATNSTAVEKPPCHEWCRNEGVDTANRLVGFCYKECRAFLSSIKRVECMNSCIDDLYDTYGPPKYYPSDDDDAEDKDDANTDDTDDVAAAKDADTKRMLTAKPDEKAAADKDKVAAKESEGTCQSRASDRCKCAKWSSVVEEWGVEGNCCSRPEQEPTADGDWCFCEGGGSEYCQECDDSCREEGMYHTVIYLKTCAYQCEFSQDGLSDETKARVEEDCLQRCRYGEILVDGIGRCQRKANKYCHCLKWDEVDPTWGITDNCCQSPSFAPGEKPWCYCQQFQDWAYCE